ncbi:hypothetical protein GCM10027049_13060 [Mucilaginibacter puniceus]
MDLKDYILTIPFVGHFAMAIYVIINLQKSNLFTKRQKKYNTVLIICLPYIWSVLIYIMLKKEARFDEYGPRDKPSNSYHESGKGFLGGH